MKKFFKNIFFYFIIALIIIIPLAILFGDFYTIFIKLGEGSIILGIIITSLALIGGVNLFRGLCAVIEKDEEKYGHKINKGWRFSIYLIFYIGGYLALFYAIIRCL